MGEGNALIKTLYYEEAGEEFYLMNIENEKVCVTTPSGTEVIECLLQVELDEFNEDVRNGKVPYKNVYSIEYIENYLSEGCAEDATISTFALSSETSAIPEIEIVSIQDSNYKEVLAKHVGTYYVDIEGSSEYTLQETDSIAIDVYDSRTYFCEINKKKKLFEAGETIQSIASAIELAVTIVQDALSASDVLNLAFDALVSDVEIVCEHAYEAQVYREATTVDYTCEMTDVELPEMMYVEQILLVFQDKDISTGEYKDATWAVADRSKTWYPCGNDAQEYAEYVADIYYRNCVINGSWTNGVNAYNGLAGAQIKLPSNRHDHIYSTSCDEYCNNCNFYRRDASSHSYSTVCDEYCNVCQEKRSDALNHAFTYWSAVNSTYHSRYCTREGCDVFEEKSHVLRLDKCVECGWDGPITSIMSLKKREQEESISEK